MRSGVLVFVLAVCAMAAGNSHSVISKHLRDAQRAFLFLAVREKGVLLLVAQKNVKGVHYQMPGGRIDEADFVAMNVTTDSRLLSEEGLVSVARYAVSRELKEETGYEIADPSSLEYLREVTDKVASERKGHRGFVKGTNLPRKMFFKIEMDYEDFKAKALSLSEEHIGYVLEPKVTKISKLLKHHSGGDPSRAVALMHKLTIME